MPIVLPASDVRVEELRGELDRLAQALARLDAKPLPGGIQGAAAEMFQAVAPELPFGQRLALSNLWLTRPLVERMLAKGDDKPWMTIDKALTELNSWRKRDSDGGLAEQLQQITDYIQKIRRMAEKLLGIQPPRQPRMAAPSHHPPSANQNQPPRYHLG